MRRSGSMNPRLCRSINQGRARFQRPRITPHAERQGLGSLREYDPESDDQTLNRTTTENAAHIYHTGHPNHFEIRSTDITTEQIHPLVRREIDHLRRQDSNRPRAPTSRGEDLATLNTADQQYEHEARGERVLILSRGQGDDTGLREARVEPYSEGNKEEERERGEHPNIRVERCSLFGRSNNSADRYYRNLGINGSGDSDARSGGRGYGARERGVGGRRRG